MQDKHELFVSNLDKIKESFEGNSKIRKIIIDWFHGGDELVISLNNNVDTKIIVSKKYNEDDCTVSYLFGYTLIGNKHIDIDSSDVESIINTIIQYIKED